MRKTLLTGIIISLSLLPLLSFAQPAGWDYATPITIYDASGSNNYNIQFPIRVNTALPISNGWMDANGDDLRFAHDCAGTNLIEYAIFRYINTDTTEIFLSLDTLLANDSAEIFMFYGNDTASAGTNFGILNGPHSSTDSVIPASTNNVVSNSARCFRFTANVDMLVTHFGKREPTGTTRYVTLWDFNTQTIIKQDTVNGPSGSYYYKQLDSPVFLNSGQTYVHCLFQGQGDGYYYGSSSQIGTHMTYNTMQYCNSCTQNTWPTNTLSNYQYGVPDFWYFLPNIPSTPPTYSVGSVLLADAPAGVNTCPGDTVMLSGNATGGDGSYSYTWGPNYNISGTSGTTTMVYPDSTFTYGLTVTDGNGCMNTDEVTISINPFSLAVSSTGVSCSNQATGTAVVNASGTGPFTYSWSNGGTTSSVSNLPTGTYSVTVVDSFGCSITETATISAQFQAPAIDLGADTSFCDGGQLILDPGSGFASYMWQNGSTFPTFTVNASGTYSVMVSDNNGCMDMDSIIVTVNQNPTVALSGLPGSICENDAAVALTVSPTGGSLTGPGALSSPPTFDPDQSGAGTVTLVYSYVDMNGCSGQDTAMTTVHPEPVAGYLVNANMLTVNFSDNSVGANSWNWSFGDGTTDTTQNPTHTYAAPGAYQVCLEVISPRGCIDEFCDSVNVAEVSVLEALSAGIDLFPNPANQELTLRHNGELNGTVQVVIFDLAGKALRTETWNATGNPEFRTRVADLPAGSYMIRIETEQGNAVKAFNVTH